MYDFSDQTRIVNNFDEIIEEQPMMILNQREDLTTTAFSSQPVQHYLSVEEIKEMLHKIYVKYTFKVGTQNN